MHGRRLAIRVLLVLSSLLPLSVATASGQGWTNRLIVTPHEDSTSFARELKRLGAELDVDLTFVRKMGGGEYVVQIPDWQPPAVIRQLGLKLQQFHMVEKADPDLWALPVLTPNDPNYSQQWHYFEDTGGVRLPGAWDISTGDPEVVVAVVDTGILNHPDLAGRTLPGYDLIGSTFRSNDGDGRDDDPSDPGNWSDGTACAARSSDWHGVHVAGTIGAIGDNDLGVAGVNWQSMLLPVRVLGECGGFVSDIADGIRWSVGLPLPLIPNNTNPAHVINLSVASAGNCEPYMQNAINAAIQTGAVLIAGTGNSGGSADTNMPANCDGVVSVTATTRSGSKASYANTGSSVDISAPGGSSGSNGIMSTYNSGSTSPGSHTYGYLRGTSMATAHVSGVASLIWSANRQLSRDQVIDFLLDTARDFPDSSCNQSSCGTGIVDATAALVAVTTPPVLTLASTAESDVNELVELTGSATDDGISLSYQWRQESGPAVTLLGADTATVSFEAPSIGSTVVLKLTVTDDVHLTDAANVTITVNSTGGNTPPVANDAALSVIENIAASATLPANDADNDPLTYELVALPLHGTVELTNSTTGAYTYTPDADFHGSDEFTFRVNDGQNQSGIGRIAVTVESTNGAPVVDAGWNQSVKSGDPVTLSGTAIDDGTIASVLWTQTSGPDVTLSDANTLNPSFTAPNVNDDLSFTLQVIDDEGVMANDSVTVTVTLPGTNAVPVASDGALLVTEDVAVTGAFPASDADGDALIYELVSPPSHGIVEITNTSTGAYVYTPSENFFGSDMFTFRVDDGVAQSASGYIAVTVSPVNDAPEVVDLEFEVDEAGELSGSLSAVDPDGDELVFRLISGATNGEVVEFDELTGDFIYRARSGASEDTFEFVVSDGTIDSRTAKVHLQIGGSSTASPSSVSSANMFALALASLACYLRRRRQSDCTTKTTSPIFKDAA